MTEEQKAKLADVKTWLEAHRSYDCYPAVLSLGEEEFPAVEYKQDHEPLPGAPNRNPHTVHGFYCLGPLPKDYQKSNRTCFRRVGDESDWYVGSHYQPATGEGENNEFHPWGRFFLLFPWGAKEAIDWHDIQSGKKPYARVPMARWPPLTD